MQGWGVGMRDETFAAAGLVFIARSGLDQCVRVYSSLCVVSGLAALDTDGVYFGNKLRYRKQVRHRTKRGPGVVLVKPGDDHPHSAIRELVCNIRDFCIEELTFINTDNLGILFNIPHYLDGGGDRFRIVLLAGVRGDLFDGIARVYHRLEDLYFLTRYPRAVQPADKLLGFAGEH